MVPVTSLVSQPLPLISVTASETPGPASQPPAQFPTSTGLIGLDYAMMVFSHVVPSAGVADHHQEPFLSGTAGSVTGSVSHHQPALQTFAPGHQLFLSLMLPVLSRL